MSAPDVTTPSRETNGHVITAGSSRSFRVTRCRFSSGFVVSSHSHERPVFGVVLEGEVDTVRRGENATASRGTVFTEPAGEAHENRLRGDGGGALLVAFELRSAFFDEWDGSRLDVLDGFHRIKSEPLAGLARRAAAELAEPDRVSPLVLESVALEILTRAARNRLEAENRKNPAWLDVALEFVRDEWRASIGLSDVAEATGVHPATLARAFRDRLGVTVGEYLRQIRVSRAMEDLVNSKRSIAAVAVECGFYDQSHLTRTFKRQTGLTPQRYRDLHDLG